MALIFTGAELVTFGGAYAVLAYAAQLAVQVYGSLIPSEMITGLSLAQTDRLSRVATETRDP